MATQKKRFDTVVVGIVLGLILPIVFGLLFISLSPNTHGFSGGIQLITHSISWAVKFGFVAMVPDFIGAFILNKTENWNACRGMILSMMFFVVALLIYSTIGV
ncbi:MAG: hypothetical protein Q4D14_00315 [Bacteroidales bacterium]|nr:hypothetical protein [Bacteroidales bacterium]